MEEKKILLVMDTTEGIANAISMRISELIGDNSQRIKDLRDIMSLGKSVIGIITANFLARNIVESPVRTDCQSFRETIIQAAINDVYDKVNSDFKTDWQDSTMTTEQFLIKWNLPSMIITRAVDSAWSRLPSVVKTMFIEFMAQLILWTDDHQMTDKYPLVFNENFWIRLQDTMKGEVITSHKHYYMDPALVYISDKDSIDYKLYYPRILMCFMLYFIWSQPVVTSRMTSDADWRNSLVLPFLTLIITEDPDCATTAWLMFMNKEQEVFVASQLLLRIEEPWYIPYPYTVPSREMEQLWILLIRNMVWNYQMILSMKRING